MESLPTIAVIATACTPNSHADVILRRWLAPLPGDADYEWTGPRTRIASLHVLQRGGEDLSRSLCEAHGLRDGRTISEALTLGTSGLAVDAVMIIGEHGDFPENEFQQKLYPRREMLDEVLAVFDRTGRTAPIFFDKHFSWDPASARAMHAALVERNIPWFGGSSIAFCPMLPEPPDLAGAGITEIVVTTWGSLEAYLFHALEVLESVVERRRGGESGVASVIAWRDASAWEALDRGAFSLELLEGALCAAGAGAGEAFAEWTRKRDQPIEIFQLLYRDGLKATIVRLNGITRKWAFACRSDVRQEPIAAAAMAGTAAQGFPHFARFARRIQDFFLTGKRPIPGSRLYLTTLACAHCMRALARPGQPAEDSAIPMPP